MSSLIKNELTKIFKKKGIYVTLLVILAFVVLVNCICKYFSNDTYFFDYDKEYIEDIKQEMANLDPNKVSDTMIYIGYKTEVDVYELKQKYEKGSWQREIIGNKLSGYIDEKNTYLYGIDKDEEKVKEVETKINQMIEKLNKDDWKFFANEELKVAEENVKKLEEEQKNTEDKQQLKEIQTSLENSKIVLEVAKYRVDKNIKYAEDYMNEALSAYQTESQNINELENRKQSLTYEEKKSYNDSIANKEISKYIIDNNVDVNKDDDVRGILRNLFSEYGIFIVVMIIMISGTIVSDEFNKGTIKLLLVKPYSRNKILLAKYIVTITIIGFSVLAVITMQLVVGGIMFGYDSLSVPVVQYNFNSNTLETMNVFAFLGINILTQLPNLIILATLAFGISTIINNSAVAIAIPLLIYMSSNIIYMLVVQNNIQFMKYFVTMNWDFGEYLFGKLPSLEGMTLGFSAIICAIYFLIIIIPTFINFKKKDIKNI